MARAGAGVDVADEQRRGQPHRLPRLGLVVCRLHGPAGTQWPLFWGVLAAAVAAVLVYFLAAYRGQGIGIKRAKESKVDIHAL